MLEIQLVLVTIGVVNATFAKKEKQVSVHIEAS